MSTPSGLSVWVVASPPRSVPAMLDPPSIAVTARVARLVVVRAYGLSGRDPEHGHAPVTRHGIGHPHGWHEIRTRAWTRGSTGAREDSNRHRPYKPYKLDA